MPRSRDGRLDPLTQARRRRRRQRRRLLVALAVAATVVAAVSVVVWRMGRSGPRPDGAAAAVAAALTSGRLEAVGFTNATPAGGGHAVAERARWHGRLSRGGRDGRGARCRRSGGCAAALEVAVAVRAEMVVHNECGARSACGPLAACLVAAAAPAGVARRGVAASDGQAGAARFDPGRRRQSADRATTGRERRGRTEPCAASRPARPDAPPGARHRRGRAGAGGPRCRPDGVCSGDHASARRLRTAAQPHLPATGNGVHDRHTAARAHRRPSPRRCSEASATRPRRSSNRHTDTTAPPRRSGCPGWSRPSTVDWPARRASRCSWSTATAAHCARSTGSRRNRVERSTRPSRWPPRRPPTRRWSGRATRRRWSRSGSAAGQ